MTAVATEATLVDRVPKGLFIAGEWLVHERLIDEFSAALSARMSQLTVGRATEPGVEVGPLIDSVERDKVSALVDDALHSGATALTGGEPLDGPVGGAKHSGFGREGGREGIEEYLETTYMAIAR